MSDHRKDSTKSGTPPTPIHYVDPIDNSEVEVDSSVLKSIRKRQELSKQTCEEEEALSQARIESPDERQRREEALLKMAKQRDLFDFYIELADLHEAHRQRWRSARKNSNAELDD
jgi:hypothetical protein